MMENDESNESGVLQQRARLPCVVELFLIIASLRIAWTFKKDSNQFGWIKEQHRPATLLSNVTRSHQGLPVPVIEKERVNQLCLYPGELPGYTGWSRPASTLAGAFETSHSACRPTTEIGQYWTCSVHCSDDACQHGGSFFYVRAYGPAVVPGNVTDYRNGTYDVGFLPLDVGLYTLEVVLTFSQPPPFEEFPLTDRQEPAYEGFMVSGFPMEISVENNRAVTENNTEQHSLLPLCNRSNLLAESPTSVLGQGRWVLTEKTTANNFSLALNADKLTKNGFANGYNSLGVEMDYYPTNCKLVEEDSLRQAKGSKSNCQNSRNTVFLFIGDSNMEKQSNWASRHALGKGQAKFMNIKGGINQKMGMIRDRITEILAQDKQYIVLFNSGLHDIMQLCASEVFSSIRIDVKGRGTERCGELYRKKLEEFVELVQLIPSVTTVFQTTTAGWPKWGTFGYAWPEDRKQPFSFSTHFVEYFNNIAWDVMMKKNVSVLDAYWITLSRPDHREASTNLKLRLVHSGPEVYSALTRMTIMMGLDTLCPTIWQ